MFYAKVLNKTLLETVQSQLNESPSKQLSLLEELALVRTHCTTVVAMYSACIEGGKQDMVLQVGTLMVDLIKHIQSLSISAAHIEDRGQDQVSIHTIEFVMNQITRIAYDCFGGDTEEAINFESRIRNEVKLPKTKQEGTNLTPEDDVINMDSTVPKE